jgi:hypothetical protein
MGGGGKHYTSAFHGRVRKVEVYYASKKGGSK